MKIKIEMQKKEMISVYGGQEIIVEYSMDAEGSNGQKNEYKIVCEIAGLPEHNPYLRVESADIVSNPTNSETVTIDRAMELFEEELER